MVTTESSVIFTKDIACDSLESDDLMSFSAITRVMNGSGETIRHRALCMDHLESKQNAPHTMKNRGISRLQNPYAE